jgi:hypothetical protein
VLGIREVPVPADRHRTALAAAPLVLSRPGRHSGGCERGRARRDAGRGREEKATKEDAPCNPRDTGAIRTDPMDPRRWTVS